MVLHSAKKRRSFCHLVQVLTALQVSPTIHLGYKTADKNTAIYFISSLISINSSRMSTLKSINCIQGFHTLANISTLNLSGNSEIVDTKHNSYYNSCSTSVQATPDIEKKYVHRVYDAIAPHFSATRFAKWPKVAEFLNSLTPGSVILDAGCGNGKYLGFNPQCFYIGCDISPPLIDICARRGQEVLVADAVNLPYRSDFGDAAISIAVLHHLSTENRRRKAVEELVRVVRKGGLVLITVWAVEQEDQSLLTKWTPLSDKYNEGWVSPSSPRTRNSSTISLESIPETNVGCHRLANLPKDMQNQSEESERGSEKKTMMVESGVPSTDEKFETNQEYFVPWHLPYHRAEISGASASALANGLAKKDDKKGAMVYNRYYHVFIEGELEKLVSGIEGAAVVEQFFDKSNWCIVLKKV